jgi:16S rRNA (uracil1498-N3)-methyltransferase
MKLGFLVGPEGGFSAKEFEMLGSLPFVRFVSLGSTVLRAETAAIAALGCWAAYPYPSDSTE